MHDTHCHVDLYENPEMIALEIEREKIFTIAVTNLPSAYYEAVPHVKRYSQIHLAVGLHPLLASHHTQQQKKLFENALSESSFVGEIGLDYSRDGISSKDTQIKSFRFVLQCLTAQKKVITLHSRRAEVDVLSLLEEYKVSPVIFHWYSGSVSLIAKIVAAGHYFSINPPMTVSKSGQAIIRAVPQDRILTETDAPFTKTDGRTTVPTDVWTVQRYLASLWNLSSDSVEQKLDQNLKQLFKTANVSTI